MNTYVKQILSVVALASVSVVSAANENQCTEVGALDPSETLAVLEVALSKSPQVQQLRADAEKLRTLIQVHADILKVSAAKPKLLIARYGDVNACTAGNFILIFPGAIRTIGGNKNALAALIGHEVAHVLRGHLSQKKAVNRAVSERVTELEKYRWTYGQESKVTNAQVQLIAAMFAYSRQQEIDADDLGIQLVGKAGYDPKGFRQLAVLVGEATGTSGIRTALFDSHPGWLERSLSSEPRILDEEFDQKAGLYADSSQMTNLKNTVDDWLQLLPNSGKAWFYKGVIQRRMRSLKSVASFEKAFTASAPPINTGEERFEDAWLYMCVGLFTEGYRYESLWCAKRLKEVDFEKYASRTGQRAVAVFGEDPKDLQIKFERSTDGRKVLRYEGANTPSQATPSWKAIRYERTLPN